VAAHLQSAERLWGTILRTVTEPDFAYDMQCIGDMLQLQRQQLQQLQQQQQQQVEPGDLCR
jgi:hypothetical protein